MDDLQLKMEPQSECIEVPKEYKPSKQDALQRYSINIEFMSRGCVIRVGCKNIPFSSTEEAMAELQKYFENPYDTQELWHKQLNN
jgi:spore coat polysaccharide biosynthesis protein SpsF (cytidylyltransferase family)